jgi:ABC-type Fe3+/spermidine/putrescine transport system ATPase subunit
MVHEGIIEVENLTKMYGKTTVLNNVSFQVNRGEFFVIMGPSPSGKTVLLRCIAGLEKPDSGSIYINGKDVTKLPAHKRKIPLMFQNFALFPHMTVFDNIAFGLKMRGYSEDKIKKEVDEVMRIVGLEGLGDRRIRELSGGQQQRVALARSLVVRSNIILLDEPLSNLDAKLQKKMMEDFKRIHKELNLTFIYVTHSLEQAMSLADRIALLNKGQIEQIGTPDELYRMPKSLFTAKFTGILNVLLGNVASRDGENIIVKTAVGVFKGIGKGDLNSNKVAYIIRPENVIIEEEAKKCDNVIEGELIEQIYKGSDMEYFVKLSDGTIFTIFKKGGQILNLEKKVGSKVFLGWNMEKALVLDKFSAGKNIEETQDLTIA